MCLSSSTRFVIMMTSSNGDIIRVTGLLCGEFTGHRWFPTQRPVTRNFCVFFDLRLKNGWVNNGEAGDLRPHIAHYDVIVTIAMDSTLPLPHSLNNYADPVYGVATICHQVRCLRWGHPSVFHTAMSLLIWYKMFCMRDISYILIWMKYINMLSVYAQSGTHRPFNWWIIAVFT